MKMKILGSGQDDGIPHTGCYCDVCRRARQYPEYRRLGPSAAIINEKESFCYLIDASPDFKYQLDMVRELIRNIRRGGVLPINGILLTHGHFGYVAGLWHLGKEAVDEKELPVFTTQEMKQFLCENYPFSLLVQRRNIKIEVIQSKKDFELDGIKFMPIEVPHRNEVGDTVAYIIKSRKTILYLPDIDKWTSSIIEEINNCDIAFIDGTFYSKKEMPRFREVPHPPIQETINLLEDVDTEIYFIHINHTNPLNKKGRQRKNIERKGFKIGHDGIVVEI